MTFIIQDHYELLFENLTVRKSIPDSDFRHVLRNALARGAEEANFRSFVRTGRQAAQFRTIMRYLLDIIDDLPSMLESDGTVIRRYRQELRTAVNLSHYLVAIEREETAEQFNMLDDRLRNPRLTHDRMQANAA